MSTAPENDLVGIRHGDLDQIASAAATAGAALPIDCRSLDPTVVAMPVGVAVMIVRSGVVRGLIDRQYKEVARGICTAGMSGLPI